MLKTTKKFYDLGFAVHLLHPKSKRPIEMGWTSGKRKEWKELEKQYQDGMNVGVRLGEASKIDDGYLTVADCDVKSKDPKHLKEMEVKLEQLFGPTISKRPMVETGRGNGSKHIYGKSPTPIKTRRLAQSKDKVKIFMPSAQKPSRYEIEHLSGNEIAKGIRIRPAWEISIMGEGSQVVLPPSVHPDTGLNYKWTNGLTNDQSAIASKLQMFDIPEPETNSSAKTDNISHKEKEAKFTPEEVDLVGSTLPDFAVNLIVSGEGIEKFEDDKSRALMSAISSMVKHRFSDNEILSVLTDQKNFLGQVAYTHRKTESRANAADWLLQYGVLKARKQIEAKYQFDSEVEIESLSIEEAEIQSIELLKSDDNWKNKLERCQEKEPGENSARPKVLLRNIILILINEASPSVFRRDTFAYREYYSIDTPWGGVKGDALKDEDAIKIKMWLSQKYRFEPKKELIFEAMSYIAGQNCFDPVKDEIDRLPIWDGEPRLDHWLKNHFEAKGDPEYLAQVFRKWMVAMIMRVDKPGAKFDWMPIFEGKQGIGKSSFGRLLVGDKYFIDWLPDLSNKDAALTLQGAWSVEMGELASLRKNDVPTVKAFVTRTVDKVRPPYGRLWIESPRRCVFFGTTNSDTYLRDDSGNRRFKPVKVGQLDFEAFKRDRDQLLAEATFLYRNGFEGGLSLELTGQAKIFEESIQAEKMVEDEADMLREKLLEFVEREAKNPPNEARFNFAKFKLSDLFDFQGPLSQIREDGRTRQFVSKALKSLGGENWKSDGTKFWRLKGFRDHSGTTKKEVVPVKNTQKNE